MIRLEVGPFGFFYRGLDNLNRVLGPLILSL